MVKIDKIQQAILRLDGGAFQQIMNAYLYKKYKFTNITCLGSETGSSKPTKGTPDTYVELDNGKYILIMYGAVNAKAFQKLKEDIMSAYNIDKTYIDESKIEKVICCYTSNNINIAQREEIKILLKDKDVELIGIDDFSYDIAHNFQSIAKTYLDIAVDSGQFCDIDEFIQKHDKNSVNAPLNIEFLERAEKEEVLENLNNEEVILLIGKAGVGKTKLAIEVCKEYITKNEGAKCLCIKNNGNDIYEDLVDYIENGQEYLIFVDDINEMHRVKSFMDFIKDKSENCKIKILATVRDYVLENVLSKLKEYHLPKLYTVNNMEDEQIRKILEDVYSIKNSLYQEKILEVANGNPRLAVLSAKGIIDKKIKNLNSVIDIFQGYYFPTIAEKNLNENDIKSLFLISLLGPINIEDDNIIKIINKFEFEKKDFIEIIQKLNKLELVDYFEGKASKISDQNFGNYVVYKFLIEDKTITISDLIIKLYPNCILKVVNVINMICSIFYSLEVEEYIVSEIKEIWKNEPYSTDSKFLYHFYNVDRTKAITVIKSEIDSTESKELDLNTFDFDGKKNNESVNDKKIEILSNFKYGELNSEAIELLIEYYKKRPDLIMDFYFGFILNLGIDEHSIDNKYKSELNIIDKFMNNISLNDEHKYNLAYLLIKIIKNFLEFEHHITKQSRKKLTINFVRIGLIPNEDVFNFRNKLFETLEQLYEIDEVKEMIEDILIDYNIYPLDDETKKIFRNDFEILTTKFFAKWENPNFFQCEILKNFKNKCKKANIDIPIEIENYKKNEQYVSINNLEFERELGEDWKKAEQERKNGVINMIKDFTTKDFSNLFEACHIVEEYQKRLNMFNINSSILDIFDYVMANKKDIFLEVFREYINKNAPFITYPDILIDKILKKYNNNSVLLILENSENNKKFCYLKGYYNSIESITDKDIENIFKLLYEQVDEEQVYIIDIKNLLKYEKAKKGTLERYCQELLKLYSKKTFVISDFFYNIFNIEQDDIERILEAFEHLEILEDLYILGSYNFMDNKGKFGISILKKDEKFIYKIIDNMKDFQRRSSELDNIFNEIWKLDNYDYYIDIAFAEIEKHRFNYLELEKFFNSEHNEKEHIILKKEEWINKYIKTNYSNIEKMIPVFEVINSSFKRKKKEYILEFLNLNKIVDDFKKIPLFSSFSSWTGSEVPLIDKKIDFLKDLNDSINGLDYIEHKDYINSEIELLKKYKLNIKVKEYLEDYL